jgi:hypothetical protein
VSDTVCLICGVPVGTSALQKALHLDEIPRGYEPHDAVPTRGDDRDARERDVQRLRDSASDMIIHHAQLHPISDCEWATRLRDALRSRS